MIGSMFIENCRHTPLLIGKRQRRCVYLCISILGPTFCSGTSLLVRLRCIIIQLTLGLILLAQLTDITEKSWNSSLDLAVNHLTSIFQYDYDPELFLKPVNHVFLSQDVWAAVKCRRPFESRRFKYDLMAGTSVSAVFLDSDYTHPRFSSSHWTTTRLSCRQRQDKFERMYSVARRFGILMTRQRKYQIICSLRKRAWKSSLKNRNAFS